MIIELEDLQKIILDADVDDIKAMEMAIISHTNNHFHLPNYSPKIIRVEGQRLYLDEPHILQVGNTVEVVYMPFYDGFYHVTDVGIDWVEVDCQWNNITTINADGLLYLTVFPPDVRAGAKKAWKYQAKADKKIGVKSESISRMSITYDKAESGQTVNGLPAYLFDFLEPYRKMRWF